MGGHAALLRWRGPGRREAVVDGKLVMPPEVLDEGMAGRDELRARLGLQAPRRSQARPEPAVVGLEDVLGDCSVCPRSLHASCLCLPSAAGTLVGSVFAPEYS
jgi:hypothetical protein